MPKTYYDSELTGAQIESALEAIHSVVTPSNNGKVLAISNGAIVAKSASEWGHGAVLEPLSVTANGDYTPPTGTDGFDSVHVAVPSATLTTKSITQNGTYNASSDNADGYSSVTVNVSGGGSVVVQPLTVTENGTYNPPNGIDGYAPVTVNVPTVGGEILYGTAAPTSSDGDNGDTYVQYQNVGGIAVVVNVTGGFNGGAVIDISFDGTSVFTATASDTYNRNYDKTHADVDVSGETITIDVTPPPSKTGKLTIAVASSQDSKTLEISAAGQNTSYGYGNYSNSYQLLTPGSGIRQATALFIKKAGVWLGVGDTV